MNDKLQPKDFMDKYISWPVALILSGAVVAIAYSQIPQTAGSHEGYLFASSTYLAMGTTYILGAILERCKRDIFHGSILVFYRFWLACGSVCIIIFWSVLCIFRVPVWEVKPNLLFAVNASIFFGGLFIAWLIARTAPAKKLRSNEQSIFLSKKSNEE